MDAVSYFCDAWIYRLASWLATQIVTIQFTANANEEQFRTCSHMLAILVNKKSPEKLKSEKLEKAVVP